MPRPSIVAVSLAALLSACAASGEPGGEKWVPLFNGKSLEGWTPKIRGYPLGENYRDTFRVRDGALVVSYDQYDQFGERFGHIFYKAPYKVYRLRFDYRFVGAPLDDTPGWAISNSGVMVFSQDPNTMAIGASFPVSIEAQLLGVSPREPNRFTGNVCTPGTNIVFKATLTTTHCLNSAIPVTPNGTWTRFEIEIAPSGEVIQRVNGAEAIRYSGVQLDPEGRMADSRPLIAAAGGRLALDGGYISLQSEGHPVEFRNIEILELR